MTEFVELNDAWWNWYFDGKKMNQTHEDRKQFSKERDAGLHPFIYKDKEWNRISQKYSSNSGKTYDSDITFVSTDGEKVGIESSNKHNRRHTRWK